MSVFSLLFLTLLQPVNILPEALLANLRTEDTCFQKYRFPIKTIVDRFGCLAFFETNCLNTDMCKSESSQSHETGAQLADSSKAVLFNLFCYGAPLKIF